MHRHKEHRDSGSWRTFTSRCTRTRNSKLLLQSCRNWKHCSQQLWHTKSRGSGIAYKKFRTASGRFCTASKVTKPAAEIADCYVRGKCGDLALPRHRHMCYLGLLLAGV